MVDVTAFSESIARPGAVVALTLRELALDELLLSLHTARFTGMARIGDKPDADRLCFREGGFVGMQPRPSIDGPGLRSTLRSLKLVSEEALAAVGDDGALEARALAQALTSQRLVAEADMDAAVAEHVRRRLFALYDLPDSTPFKVRQGLDQLAGFWPVSLDVRPLVAFGMVNRADPRRRSALLDRVGGRQVQIVAPYDAQRNSYGLPPPVVSAMRSLEVGQTVDGSFALAGLSNAQTAGLLLLLDRMSLLRVE